MENSILQQSRETSGADRSARKSPRRSVSLLLATRMNEIIESGSASNRKLRAGKRPPLVTRVSYP
ncbi:hypothetical protein X777_02231 [Ooceraea biroi]|uniref:Uncharacterized protein n=1 Tax=Ooceraea biroi TaxID=2015173 RepID=A0A026WKR0_OOCBI|nr:hypothetical protein X777_02231 [Ooceraea biroi]